MFESWSNLCASLQHPFGSSHCDITIEQVQASLQNIFQVQLPNSLDSKPDFMPLSDLAEILTSLPATQETETAIPDFNELISDVLAEVLQKISFGGTQLMVSHLNHLKTHLVLRSIPSQCDHESQFQQDGDLVLLSLGCL